MKSRKVDQKDWDNVAAALGLTAVEAHEAFPSLAVLVCPAGTRIIREGEPGVDVYIVAKGELQVSVTSFLFFNKDVAPLKAGDFFGEVGFLVDQGRSATVTTKTAGEVYRILAHELQAVIQDRADIGKKLEEAARQRLQALSDSVARN